MSKFTTSLATSHNLSLAAMEEASRVGQRTADIDHLFLALVMNKDVAGQVLRKASRYLRTRFTRCMWCSARSSMLRLTTGT